MTRAPATIATGPPALTPELLEQLVARAARPDFAKLQAQLRSTGYAILSCSPESGADVFVKQRRSLHLFFQGHPEYERTTLFKEYRRDVGRFLSGEQSTYPPLPCRYFSAEAAAALREFQDRALSQRTAELLTDFPAAAAAGALSSWRPAGLTIYRNWLSWVAKAKAAAGTAVQAQA